MNNVFNFFNRNKGPEKTPEEIAVHNKVAVARAIVTIKDLCEGLAESAMEYKKVALEAYKLGQDSYGDQLVDTILELQDIDQFLNFVILKLRTAIFTAELFNNLNKLTKAVGECQKFLCQGIDAKKLGMDLNALLNPMGNTLGDIKQIMGSVGTTMKASGQLSDSEIMELAGITAKTSSPDEKAKRREQMKKDIQLQLMIDLNPQSPVSDNQNKQDAMPNRDAAYNIDDIVSALDSEKKN